MKMSDKTVVPIIVGIAGGSCSGKTTLAKLIANMVGDERCTLIRQDDYYIDLKTLRPDGGLPNFDAPDSLEFSLLAKHLGELKAGASVKVPTYDFATHTRQQAVNLVDPRPLIIVEGILILTQADVRAQLDHSLYMKCSKRLRYSRRVARDVQKRGRSSESVAEQFNETVQPSHEK